jgi:hypothetical protein
VAHILAKTKEEVAEAQDPGLEQAYGESGEGGAGALSPGGPQAQKVGTSTSIISRKQRIKS